MNGSKGFSACRILALPATLFGAMLTAFPAYGQQEVNPDWYNPWTAPKAAAVHASQARTAMRPHQPKLRPVSSRSVSKVRGKQPARPS